MLSGNTWVRVHQALLILWALTIPAAFVFGWWESVPFVVFASVYANVATHWGAMQAARTERKQDEA